MLLVPDEARVSGIAVALHLAAEVGAQDIGQAGRGSAGLPMVEGVAARSVGCPQVAEFGFASAGIKVTDRGLVNLHVTPGHYPGADRGIDRRQPIGGQSYPSGQAGPGQMDLMASSEDVLLAVKRQVIDVFAHDDGGQESRGGDAAFLQSLGQGRSDRRLLAPLAANIFAADQTTQQKPRGFIIKLLADLRAEQAPHQPVDLLLHQTQMLLQPRVLAMQPHVVFIALGDLGQKLLAVQVLHTCYS